MGIHNTEHEDIEQEDVFDLEACVSYYMSNLKHYLRRAEVDAGKNPQVTIPPAQLQIIRDVLREAIKNNRGS